MWNLSIFLSAKDPRRICFVLLVILHTTFLWIAKSPTLHSHFPTPALEVGRFMFFGLSFFRYPPPARTGRGKATHQISGHRHTVLQQFYTQICLALSVIADTSSLRSMRGTYFLPTHEDTPCSHYCHEFRASLTCQERRRPGPAGLTYLLLPQPLQLSRLFWWLAFLVT
jgi:hypothetical protein